MKDQNSWITQSKEKIIESPVMTVVKKKCVHSQDASKKHDFFILESNDWCNIIPVTEDGKIVLIEQYRIGTDEMTLEIPGGVVDETDSDISKAAIRELEEETGYTPIDGANLQDLGWGNPNPAIQDNKCHCFILGPVRKTKEPNLDPGEIIKTVEVEITEIADLLKKRAINHSLIQNAFLGVLLLHKNTEALLSEQLNQFVNPSKKPT